MNVLPVFIIFEMLLTYPEDSWNLRLVLKAKCNFLQKPLTQHLNARIHKTVFLLKCEVWYNALLFSANKTVGTCSARRGGSENSLCLCLPPTFWLCYFLPPPRFGTH